MGDDIRIILVEDSPTVRRYLASLIEEAPDMCVVGEATNGEEAIQLVENLRPDVVSMDINMPRVDGLQATRQIMAQTPTPIVVVSSLLDVDVALSLQAIEAGALAVVSKPPARQNPSFELRHRQLLNTLRAMAGVKVISRRVYPKHPTGSLNTGIIADTSTRPELIVIGASTGGPRALIHLLQTLPADLPIPMVIVQHMPHAFIEGLVTWLDSVTDLKVIIGYDNLQIKAGMVVVASGDEHLTITQTDDTLMCKCIQATDQSRHIPSIDVLFESVAETLGKRALGILLTGMGDDGAQGLLKIRQAGGYTLAQDETTSTVFGMPNAAIKLGAVQKIVPLGNLASQIQKLL